MGIAAGLAVAAALPVVRGSASSPDRPPDHGLATAGVLEHDLLVEDLPVDGGRMRVSGGTGRGLGIEINERALARFLVESAGGG